MTKETVLLDPKTEAVMKRKGYLFDKKLNEGAFGQVYKGTNTNTGESVAIKIMDLGKVGEKFKDKFLPRELASLMGIQHENVICVLDIIKSGNKMFIFMEFANGGDITGYLQKNGAIPEELSCYWFTQTTNALQYCHDVLKIAHRDIKIDNILLHNNVAKLTDFGFSRQVLGPQNFAPVESPVTCQTFCGTEPYYSPQLVARKPYDAFSVDIWAMGVTLFCMLNNKFPYHHGDAKKMLQEQYDPNYVKSRYTKKFPSDLRNFQERMFEPEERYRINAKQMLNHPWILRKGK